MKKIIFVTNTEGKIKEAQNILGDGFQIELKKLDLDEIQTVNGKEVIKKKAEEAYNLLGCAILVEDTSCILMHGTDFPELWCVGFWIR